MFDMDEGVRPDTIWKFLQNYVQHFSLNGTVTAGNSSQMSDGAASVLVMDREKAEAEGFTPLAKITFICSSGGRPELWELVQSLRFRKH